MRKLALVAAVFLLSSGWTMAKANTDQTTLIRGCLSGAAGNYVLTDGPGYDYQLEGNTSKLENMVGSEVQVRGVETLAPADDNSTNGRINVKKTMKLHDTCGFAEDQK